MKITNITIILTFLIFKNNFSMQSTHSIVHNNLSADRTYYIFKNNLSTAKASDVITMATQRAYMMGLHGEIFLIKEILKHCDTNGYPIIEKSINSYLQKIQNTPNNILEVLEDAYDLGEAYRNMHMKTNRN